MMAHLWQSTAWVGLAWAIGALLRRNSARARYWIWFSASAKFLIPFSLLVGLGAMLPRPQNVATAPRAWAAAIDQLAEPVVLFSGASIRTAARPAPDSSLLPAALWIVWMVGFAAVSVSWLVRWRRIQAMPRFSADVEFPIAVQYARGLMEPGIFGIFRPTLLLPEGIAGRLDSAQLQAILAHELCHVRRRDNLTSGIHMLVQAIFWFHPLVWWLGTRLVQERELACDEDVLRRGIPPQVYAEGILNVCRLYLESPLACVSGVTGSDLKKRIETILANRPALRLTYRAKAVLGLAAGAALSIPVLVGLLNAPSVRAQDRTLTFEAASVKPATVPAGMTIDGERVLVRKGSGISIPKNTGGPGTGDPGRIHYPLITLKGLLKRAWDSYYAIEGPGWLESQAVSVDATMAPATTQEQFRQMLRNLIIDRFALQYHVASREVTGYALVVSKSGLKMKESPVQSGGEWARFAPAGRDPDGFPIVPPTPGHWLVQFGQRGRVRIRGQQVTIQEMLDSLSHSVNGAVTDQTGLTARYDFTVTFASDLPPAAPAAGEPGESAPDIFSALQSQLGLKLEPKKIPVEILVIDHMDRTPSGN